MTPTSLLPRYHPATLRAAAWTWRAVRASERGYADRGLGQVELPAPPDVPDGAVRGVRAVLRRSGARCLVRSTVLQRWEAAQGRPRDLVVGVTKPSEEFKAHAWLDGDPPCHSEGFVELTRRSA